MHSTYTQLWCHNLSLKQAMRPRGVAACRCCVSCALCREGQAGHQQQQSPYDSIAYSGCTCTCQHTTHSLQLSQAVMAWHGMRAERTPKPSTLSTTTHNKHTAKAAETLSLGAAAAGHLLCTAVPATTSPYRRVNMTAAHTQHC